MDVHAACWSTRCEHVCSARCCRAGLPGRDGLRSSGGWAMLLAARARRALRRPGGAPCAASSQAASRSLCSCCAVACAHKQMSRSSSAGKHGCREMLFRTLTAQRSDGPALAWAALHVCARARARSTASARSRQPRARRAGQPDGRAGDAARRGAGAQLRGVRGRPGAPAAAHPAPARRPAAGFFLAGARFGRAMPTLATRVLHMLGQRRHVHMTGVERQPCGLPIRHQARPLGPIMLWHNVCVSGPAL